MEIHIAVTRYIQGTPYKSCDLKDCLHFTANNIELYLCKNKHMKLSTTKSILKKEQCEKIAPCIFSLIETKTL